MNIFPIKESYLNISTNLYDSDFINLAQIEDNKLNFGNKTLFLNEEQKRQLNSQPLKYFNNVIYIFEFKGIYGVVCDINTNEYKNGNIKCHELVIPETIQGMMSNYHGYNAETAPVLLGHEVEIDYAKYINRGNYSYQYKVNDWTIYAFEGENCDDLCHELKKINKTYIADGHHRLYTSSILSFKDTVVSCLIEFKYLKIKPIHRVLSNITPQMFNQARDFITTKFKTIDPNHKMTKGRVKITYQDETIALEMINLDGDLFWNNDIYRLNTQIISQAFRIFDHSQVDYLSDEQLIERKLKLKDDEVMIETYRVKLNEFIECADKNSIMPPKSTWFSPKFPSFLIFKKYQ